jgi:hypothetical protein
MVQRGVLMQIRVLVVGTAAVFLLLALSGCEGGVFGVRGSGNVITESRDVSGFSEIALTGSGKVRVDVNGTESLIIEAEDNIMPLLTSEVNGGRLELGAESSISPTTDVIYTVGAIALEGVAVSGSGQATAAGVAAASFDVEISGSGRVEPTGTAGTLGVEISGSGRYLGEDLEASVGTVRVSGSGGAVVNVTDDLDVDVSGSGDVQYIGDPRVTESITGSGDISRK